MVHEDDTAHLFDLIGFCVSTLGLQVEDVFDAFLGENVMTATDALRKAQALQQMTESVKGDIGVRCAAARQALGWGSHSIWHKP